MKAYREEAITFLSEASLLCTAEIEAALGTKELDERCIGCSLLTDELKVSDAERASEIIDDVAHDCP